MGTRADFYVGRGKTAEWIGSIAMDGYPDGIIKSVLEAGSEKDYRQAVTIFLEMKHHATTPEMGWPWPWDDSNTTDYAYAFDEGKVHACCFGGPWFDPMKDEPEQADSEQEFPKMPTDKFAQAGTERSGIMMIFSRIPAEPKEGA